MQSSAFVTRDSFNQDHHLYINGNRIDLVRLPERDTQYHATYGYTLTTKKGEKLFGKAGDTVGIPKAYAGKRSSAEAALLAFSAATMQEQATDEEFFNDYTEAEMAWCRSFACEQLGYEVSDRLEAAGLN